ncbi:MAG: hypothetical protein AB7G47_18190, partial [Mycolicibacterium sp.]|uniref:hypothetical protein n=1 Tax=Mycolicibacterium sp. TaxID=2320850 RepID=UPI003D105B92
WVIDPADPANPQSTPTLTGDAAGSVVVFADGTGYQTVNYTDPETGERGVVVWVIDPADPANPQSTPTLIGGTIGSVVVTADGTGYQTVIQFDPETGEPTTVVQVIDPADPANAQTTPTLPGAPIESVVVTADGTGYQTIRLSDGTTVVMVIDPADPANAQSTPALPGAPIGSVVVTADGTGYQTIRLSDETTVVMVIDPADPTNAQTTPVIPGGAFESVVVTADGTGYQTVVSTDPETGEQTTVVMVIDPADPANAQTTPVIPGQAVGGSVVVAADGTGYQTMRVIDFETGEQTTVVMVIDPADPTNPLITPPVTGNPDGPVVVAADGTAYQTISDGFTTVIVLL